MMTYHDIVGDNRELQSVAAEADRRLRVALTALGPAPFGRPRWMAFAYIDCRRIQRRRSRH